MVAEIGKASEKPKAIATWELLVGAGSKWASDNVPRLSAAISFYAALSLAPFLILATVLGVYLLGASPASRASFIFQTREFFGPESALLVERIVKNGAMKHSAGVVASVIGFAVMFFSASNLFLQFDDSMRTIWGVREKGSLVRIIIRTRLKAFASVILLAVGLVGWLYMDARMAFIARETGGLYLGRIISFISTVLVLSLICLAAMKRPSEMRLKWSDVWPGAILAAVSISTAKYLLSLYFANSAVGSVYGPAGALVLILLWIYYCCQLFFFGAEFVYVYAHRYGSLANQTVGVEGN